MIKPWPVNLSNAGHGIVGASRSNARSPRLSRTHTVSSKRRMNESYHEDVASLPFASPSAGCYFSFRTKNNLQMKCAVWPAK